MNMAIPPFNSFGTPPAEDGLSTSPFCPALGGTCQNTFAALMANINESDDCDDCSG
jgi:hypothetical protein